MKQVKIFGKSVPVMLVALLAFASIGTAALVATYGTIIGSTISVESGVTVEGGDLTYTIGDSPAVAGNTYLSDVFTVKNKAETATEITLDTRCNNSDGYDDGTQYNMSIDWIDVVGNNRCNGIVTSYFGVLELTSKDSDWQPTDAMNATLHYSLVGAEFGYDLTAIGLDDVEYVLIYYADDEPRYNNWGGNPALELGRATANGGILNLKNSVVVSESLPYASDWNTGNYPDSVSGEYANYCNNVEGDNYKHCTGAKIWLVLSADYNEATKKMTAWHQVQYLYETDLITYTKGTDNKITLPANGGGFNFVVKNALASNLESDVYTIKTDVSPA